MMIVDKQVRRYTLACAYAVFGILGPLLFIPLVKLNNSSWLSGSIFQPHVGTAFLLAAKSKQYDHWGAVLMEAPNFLLVSGYVLWALRKSVQVDTQRFDNRFVVLSLAGLLTAVINLFLIYE